LPAKCSASQPELQIHLASSSPASADCVPLYRQATHGLPIVLGYSANGREALSAYQVAGETSGGRALPQWRCFYLDGILELETAHAAWREGDSHRQPQTCVGFVDVDVNIPESLTRPESLLFGSSELRPPRRTRRSGP
jgi:hypothetical protein